MIRTAFQHRLKAYRNPIYIVYGFSGIVIFYFGLVYARGGVGSMENHIFRIFNELPQFISPIFTLISLFGTIGFVIVASAISLLRRHYSHAVKFMLAGTSAWLIVKWLKEFSFRARPSEILSNVQLRETIDSTIGYPSGHAAVATALGVVAYMYAPKKYHRYITWMIISVCISRLYLGMHLPVDLLGGYGVGLAIASFLNYAFGDTQGKFVPTSVIREKLAALKLDINSVKRANVDARGSTPFFVTVNKGPNIFIKVVDTSNNVADWLFKLSRKVLYRRLEDESPFLSPKRQLEHEAYVAGLALSNGIRTPRVVGIFHVKEDMWAMGQEMIPGKSLDKVDATRINNALLIEIWKQVRALHDANIIHRDLRAANIFLDDQNTPWLIDFGFSEASVSSRSFHRDTVELIASLSCITDASDVIDTALKVIGKQELLQALPYLDYASLSGATTNILKSDKGRLDDIRNILKNKLSVKVIENEKVKRFDLKTLIYVAVIGLAVYVIIPQLSDLSSGIETIKNSRVEYLVLAVVFSVITYFASAAVFRFISILPIGYFKTLLITVSTSFTNRLLPASTGYIATIIRFFQKSGYSTTEASSLTALNNLLGFIGHMTILFVVAGLSQSSLREIIVVPVSRKVVFFAMLVFLSLALAVIIIKPWRRRAKKILQSAKKDLSKLSDQPARFAFALLSAMAITTFYALTLYVCTLALNVEISVLQAFFVFTIGVTAASVTPTPGGIGGAEAGLVAGFVSIGLPSETGLSIALLYRTITFWLPIIPGFIAFHLASKRNYI